MKKRIILPALIASIFATTVGALASTLAWFNEKNKFSPDTHLGGASNGAYFGGGDGSSSDPFLIKTPRHLYNLAWLQYIGYFNRDEKINSTGEADPDGDGVIDKQYYFKLSNDIDMTGWKIPPIGTSLYPFVGNFDGNNCTVSNLMTTNRYQDYNKVPSSVKSTGSVSNVDIVGFFGVVGTLANSGNSITSGSKSYTYSTSAVSIHSFGLDNYSSKSVTNSTLIGLVAGYVNGPISQVAVKDSKIVTNGNSALSYTTKLSDYSLAGFVRDAYKDNILKNDVSAITPSVENETQSGSGDEFGASIDMKTMYDRLLGIKNGASQQTYNTSETYIDGVIDDSATETSNYVVSGSTTLVGNSETDDSGNKVSSYSFRSDSGTYLYIAGDGNKSYSKTTTNYNTLTSAPANNATFYINDGDNFLRNNNGTLSNTTRANATLWTLASNKIRSGTGNNSYLRVNNGSLTTSNQNNGSTWTFTKQTNGNFAITTTVSGTTYVLTYHNNAWTALNTSSLPATYKLSYNSNYMRWGGTSDTVIYNETNVNNATEWEVDNNGYYSPVGYSTYYIGYGNSRLQAATNNSVNFTMENDNNNRYLYGRTGNWLFGYTYYYAKYGTPSWTYSSNGTQGTAKNNGSALTITTITKGVDYYAVHLYGRTVTNTTETKTSNPTYFPLSYEENVDAQGQGLGTYNNNVAEKNTGYVVSGSNYGSSAGDIRVSKYANHATNTYDSGETMKQLYASLNDSNLYSGTLNNHNCNLHVVTRTADTNGYVILKDAYNSSYNNYSSDLTSKISTTKTVTEAGLVKYTASRNQMHTLLNSTLTTSAQVDGYTYVYGLHFMDAAISPTNKITVPYAYINGTEYNQYQLPRDSIDFNLKNNGYINFFAGTYFPGNTTFFSLHNIFRDGNNNITNIKEISKIYKNTGSNWKTVKYIYQYTDGTLNDNIGTYDSSSPMFDMEWVTDPTMVEHALYYFEIPVNKGEYALGSVANKNGAYLIYLDIGAGVKTKNITTYTEQITTVTDTYVFIKGIEFVAVIPTTAEGFAAITGEGVANVGIPSGANGDTTFNYNASDKILTCGPPGSATLTASYIQNGVTVSVTGGSDLVATAISSSTTILDKVTTITYDNETGDVVKIISTKETIDGNEGVWDEGDPEVIEEGVQEYEIATLIDSAGAVIAHFHYQYVNGATVTIESEYDSETDTYSFTITSTVNLVIYVDSVLASAEVGGVEVDYTVTINGNQINTGDVVNIAAS